MRQSCSTANSPGVRKRAPVSAWNVAPVALAAVLVLNPGSAYADDVPVDEQVCPHHPDCPEIESGVRIRVEITYANIGDFAEWFSGLTRVTFLVSDAVEPELRVSLVTDAPERLSDIYLHFLAVLEENGLAAVPRDGALVIVRRDLLAPPGPVTEAAFAFETDLDGDGELEEVAVFRSTDGRRGFLSVGEAPEQVVSPIYPLWTAAPARFQGSDRSEVVLGVWSHMRRHDEPDPHRALWVVGLTNGGFAEHWRGSALARPLVDFRVADLDGSGDSEVLALERQYDNCYLTAYAWTGFGFRGLARRLVSCDAVTFCEAAPSQDPTLCVDNQRQRAHIENEAISLDSVSE